VGYRREPATGDGAMPKARKAQKSRQSCCRLSESIVGEKPTCENLHGSRRLGHEPSSAAQRKRVQELGLRG
jgi:hypothetical protein